MSDLWELSMPWWEFVLRGAASYLGLLILLRMSGKRSFGEMSPFDIVVLILVGGTLRSAIVGKDTTLLGPMIAVTTILLVDKVLCLISAFSPTFDRLMEGVPVVLARRGRVDERELKRQTISRAAFDRELRNQQTRDVGEVDEAILEPNGRISVFKRTGS